MTNLPTSQPTLSPTNFTEHNVTSPGPDNNVNPTPILEMILGGVGVGTVLGIAACFRQSICFKILDNLSPGLLTDACAGYRKLWKDTRSDETFTPADKTLTHKNPSPDKKVDPSYSLPSGDIADSSLQAATMSPTDTSAIELINQAQEGMNKIQAPSSPTQTNGTGGDLLNQAEVTLDLSGNVPEADLSV